MMLLTAEYQKRCIGQSTSQKLQAMKANGKVLGRKRTHDNDIRQQVIAYHSQGHTLQECADRFDVSKASAYRFVKESKKESK